MITNRNTRAESGNASVDVHLVTIKGQERLIININGTSADFPVILHDPERDLPSSMIALKEAVNAL
jgi:hypothetical protein